MLCELIERVHNNDECALSELIEKFKPLLIKYARKINMEFEDAYSEMVVGFIVLMKSKRIRNINNKIDNVYLSYIKISIKFLCEDIRLSNNKQMIVPLESEHIERYLNRNVKSTMEDLEFIFLDEYRSILTDREFETIVLIFFEDKIVIEIAKIMGITRVTANETKVRALKKLKKYLMC